MKLRCITEQSEGLHQVYALSAWSEEWQSDIEAMRALVDHLEHAVDYPEQWVCTAQETLVFKETDDGESPWVVTIRPCISDQEAPLWAQYEIHYRAESPWLAVLGYAGDLKTAGDMIVEGLSLTTQRTVQH